MSIKILSLSVSDTVFSCLIQSCPVFCQVFTILQIKRTQLTHRIRRGQNTSKCYRIDINKKCNDLKKMN
jgi:hypothetical protein